MSPRIGSLFTGMGGLDFAVCDVFGGRLAWVSDIDAAAVRILAHHWPDVPNIGDMTSVDWRQVAAVDVLAAGWPCQPWSTIGTRRGLDDERAIWPDVHHAIRLLRPALVALENVPSIVRAGEFARVADSLANLGYGFAWTCMGASDVGAPHRRRRLFILAAADSAHLGHAWTGPTRRRRNGPANGGVAAADAVDWGTYAPAIQRWEAIIGRPAPTPTQIGRHGRPHLAPRFSEWLMGLPAGHVTAVPGLTRHQQLRLLGNGVVPQQATAAYAWCAQQLTAGEST